MPKNAYFLEKRFKIAAAPRGSAPELSLASGGCGFRLQPPALLFPLTNTDLSACVFIVNLYYYFEK